MKPQNPHTTGLLKVKYAWDNGFEVGAAWAADEAERRGELKGLERVCEQAYLDTAKGAIVEAQAQLKKGGA